MKRTQTGALLGGAFLLPAMINLLIDRRSSPPPIPLEGDSMYYDWPHCRIQYTTAGTGSPLLLLHGIYAGASSYEWRKNFHELSRQHTVYAPCLPGFGLSEKPNIHYNAELYVRAIQDFCRDVIGEPAVVVASSLSAAFCVAAQAYSPIARRLALVCPTGIETLTRANSSLMSLSHAMLSIPIWNMSLYNSITSQRGISSYMRQMVYHNPAFANDAVVRVHHAMAHQPGAFNAARAFITGQLNIDIKHEFKMLDVPVLLLWGQHAAITPPANAKAFLQANPTASLHIFQNSSLLPHDEQASTFNRSLIDFTKLSLQSQSTEQYMETVSDYN